MHKTDVLVCYVVAVVGLLTLLPMWLVLLGWVLWRLDPPS